MLRFDDLTAQRLVDRYNVALAQAVLLRSVLVDGRGPQREARAVSPALPPAQVPPPALPRRGEHGRRLHLPDRRPAEPLQRRRPSTACRWRCSCRRCLHCADFRLDAELRWGPKREPRSFHLESSDGLISHQADTGTYVPAEIWRVRRAVPPGRPGLGGDRGDRGHRAGPRRGLGPRLPVRPQGDRDRRLRRGRRLLEEVEPRPAAPRLLPRHGPPRYVLAISDRLKVDEEALGELPGPILRFKEIPNAPELAALLETFVKSNDSGRLF